MFFQGGVELMNKPGLQGDKEVMTMIQESLPGISLKNILLELGSAKFYNRLLELVGNQRNELEDILRLRDISEMKRIFSYKANINNPMFQKCNNIIGFTKNH